VPLPIDDPAVPPAIFPAKDGAPPKPLIRQPDPEQLPVPVKLPCAPLPESLKFPVGPVVSVVNNFANPSESLKVPDEYLPLATVAKPADPAVLVRSVVESLPVPLDPPPPPKVNNDPVTEADKLVTVPSPAVLSALLPSLP
jgi:hypothetical protein